MAFRFEGLEIWHKAREFSTKIHEITVKFPRYEMYALADQMNRASDAVSLLIAEGSGLQTDALFSHRLGLAVGETFEVIYLWIIPCAGSQVHRRSTTGPNLRMGRCPGSQNQCVP